MPLLLVPEVKIEWTITIGNLIWLASAMVLAVPAFRIYKTFLLFMGEHEVLIDVACQMLGLTRKDFSQKAVLKLAEKRELAREAKRAVAGRNQ